LEDHTERRPAERPALRLGESAEVDEVAVDRLGILLADPVCEVGVVVPDLRS